MDKIDVRDLRVGNWVYSSFSETPCKVNEVRLHDSGYGSCKVTGVDGYKDVASLSPIPLTGEILEKNGIKKLVIQTFEVTYCCNTPYISCTFFKLLKYWLVTVGPAGSKKYPYTESSGIKYVHQLQNILHDAGIEKEIAI